ncbi:SGNH hydrolase-type esterase domain-containing protein [Artemisia annua]|uniref:SGNH hydrolase-type esterase domain-containing protein n=1 Tax=Artemisia annua TaxID=35608 RepID=A0A2U1NS25_ARTAN|nr:SGNH hydrolase-type esterase domain-containing protein [Artemisia annua]
MAAALYNPQLEDMLTSLNNEVGSHVFVGVNTRKILNDFMSDPIAYGQAACCGQGPCNGMGLCTAMSNLCSNSEQYAFWDNMRT